MSAILQQMGYFQQLCGFPNDGRDWAAGWSAGTQNPGYAFNGNESQASGHNGGSFTCTYTFSPAMEIPGGTAVRVKVMCGASSGQVGGTGNMIVIDGSDISAAMKSAGAYASWAWITVTSEVGGTFNTIVLNGVSGSTNPGIAAIEIGGEKLETGACS